MSQRLGRYVLSSLKFFRTLVLRKSAYRFFIRDWRSLGDLRRCTDAVATLRHSVNLEPVLMKGPQDKRIFVIAPHPDDEILGAGGTLISAIERGAKVRVLYLTRGKTEQADILAEEARTVANQVGYEIRFLDYFTRQIPLDCMVVNALRKEIEALRPGVILLPFFCDDHDDHRRASHLLCLTHQAVPLPRGIEIWAYQVYSTLIPNVVVDITAFAERKRRAIESWRSQAVGRDWAHFSLGLNAFNSRFLPGGVIPQYAEPFFVLPLEEYYELCTPYFAGDAAQVYYSDSYVRS